MVDDSTISNNLTGNISSGTLTVDDGSVISSNSVTGVELDGGSANLTGSIITGNAVGLWLEGNNITASGGVQNDAVKRISTARSPAATTQPRIWKWTLL